MSGSANQPAAAPTTSVIPTSDDSSFDALPLEFLQLPEVEATALDKEPNQTNTKPVVSHSFVIYHDTRVDHVFGVYQGDTGKNDQHDHNHDARSRLMSTIHRRMSEPSNAARVQLASRLASRCRADSSMSSQDSQHDMNTKSAWESIRHPVQLNSPETPSITVEDPICFATHGTCGVLDLGASKTVIGSELVPELVKGLQECIPGQVQRCPCRITFRFGNQGTLTSQQAIVVPIGKLMLKIAIVEGRTPFLLSNTLMRALGANIDCKENALHSPLLNQAIPLELTSRGLFLIDVCHLIQQSCTQSHRQKRSPSAKSVSETHAVHEESEQASTISRSFSRVPKPHTNQIQSEESVEPHALMPTHHVKPIQDEKPEETHVTNRCNNSVNSKNVNAQHETSRTVSDQVQQISRVSQDSSPVNAFRVSTLESKNHVPADVFEPTPGPCAGKLREHCDATVTADTGAASHRENPVWPETSQQDVRGGVAVGSPMGEVCGQPLPGQHQGSTCPIHALRPSAAPGSGARSSPESCETSDSGATSSTRVHDATAKAQGQSEANGPAGIRSAYLRSLGGRGAPRSRGSVRDVSPRDYGEPFDCWPGADSEPHPEHRDCTESGRPALGQQHGQWLDAEWGRTESVKPDVCDEPVLSASCESSILRELIIKFQQEFHEFLQKYQPVGSPYQLAEVFCSDRSPLVQQVQALGSHAFRFGLAQGDLATESGRAELFKLVAVHRPKDVWFSPTCGPWSAWTNLNSARSMEHYMNYQNQRRSLLYQIALGSVLCRHQVQHGRQMHWEQPSKSKMLDVPHMSEIHAMTQAAECDLCTIGNLRDPISQKHIRKSLVILTTSRSMFNMIHGRKCHGQHEHQQIEGSINVDGSRMNRSQYTEVYLRKFARAVAQQMCRSRLEKPMVWHQTWPLLQACSGETREQGEALVISRIRAPSRPARSELISPESSIDPQTKRRRLTGKHTPGPDLEIIQDIISRVDQVLPRVGKREIVDSETIKSIQQSLPDKSVVKVIACRGTDRTIGPPPDLRKDEAPYRRAILRLRGNGEAKLERHWERWDVLSNRQLIRPAHACRINITVFARNHQPSEGSRAAIRTETPASSSSLVPKIRSAVESRSSELPAQQIQEAQPSGSQPVNSDKPGSPAERSMHINKTVDSELCPPGNNPC